MNQRIVSLLLCLLLGACSKQHSPGNDVAASAVATTDSKQPQQFLAYARALQISTSPEQVKPLYEKLIATCLKDSTDQCQQMGSQLDAGPQPMAVLKFRLKAAGVPVLKAALTPGGELTAETSSVEDLAQPITDNNRRIALLKNYEQSLMALENRPGIDMDNLMKVSKELASTQAELEQLTGDNAHFMDRVNLQTLEIDINSAGAPSALTPVGAAFSNSLREMGESFAVLVNLLAVLLPWIVVLVPGLLLLRKLWRRRRGE